MKTFRPVLSIAAAQVAFASVLSFAVSAAEVHVKTSSGEPLGEATRTRPHMIEVDAAFPGGNIMVDSMVDDVITLHRDGRDTTCDWFYYGSYGSESIERLARNLEAVQTGPLVFRLEDYLPHRNDHLKWSDPTPTNTPHLSFNKWARELPGGVVSGLIELPYAKATGRPVTADSATRFGHDLSKAI